MIKKKSHKKGGQFEENDSFQLQMGVKSETDIFEMLKLTYSSSIMCRATILQSLVQSS